MLCSSANRYKKTNPCANQTGLEIKILFPVSASTKKVCGGKDFWQSVCFEAPTTDRRPLLSFVAAFALVSVLQIQPTSTTFTFLRMRNYLTKS